MMAVRDPRIDREREATGSHAIPPPAPLPREIDTGAHRPIVAMSGPPMRQSSAPFTRWGLSWVALGGVLAVLLVPGLLALVRIGRVLEQLEQLRADVAPLVEEQREDDTRIAVLQRDVAQLERDLEKMERRTPARE